MAVVNGHVFANKLFVLVLLCSFAINLFLVAPWEYVGGSDQPGRQEQTSRPWRKEKSFFYFFLSTNSSNNSTMDRVHRNSTPLVEMLLN
jgi:hypothetical protein